jgi:hypothetical protein
MNQTLVDIGYVFIEIGINYEFFKLQSDQCLIDYTVIVSLRNPETTVLRKYVITY